MSDVPTQPNFADGEATSPSQPCASGVGDAEARDRQCDREFDHYYEERREWVKAQLESEHRYDTLLTTICTLALGATMLKGDLANRGGIAGVVFLVLAWTGFASCLMISLLHQYLTYRTHKEWLAVVDAEFADWKPHAMARVMLKYDQIPFIKRVEGLKTWAGCAVVLGVLTSFGFFLTTLNTSPAADAPKAVSAVDSLGDSETVNVYPDGPKSLPTTRP